MDAKDYPALFRHADKAAGIHQRTFFRLLMLQYIALIIASASTVVLIYGDLQLTTGIYLFAIVLAGLAQLANSVNGSEAKWYSARALAESLKTMTWRFAMAAEPFEKTASEEEAIQRFREKLQELLVPHRNNPSLLTPGVEHGEIVSPKILAIRKFDLSERKRIYLNQRISNQQDWYIGKASSNRTKSSLFSAITGLIYVCAFVFGVFQIIRPEQSSLWWSEPVLVLAAAILGWSQAKRFRELSATYSFTAHEISFLRSLFTEQISEKRFAELVADAEFAFSREHTQWAART